MLVLFGVTGDLRICYSLPIDLVVTLFGNFWGGFVYCGWVVVGCLYAIP